ncbi:MAG: hypothetical protein JXX29_13435 [Deltaproteobacteria bacterium]|nr:hypothetical protein [Deltaproteobacteria bacterium]MBN2672681.1 hypothetical protein [Deltaproteobacteria bacterium]
MLHLDASEIQKLEQALQTELALELDTHQLIVEPSFQFSAASLSKRIHELRQVAAKRNSDAVIWLERSGAHTVTLQLVVVAPGQSTVRSVEADVTDDEIGELVIAARELLHDIYIPTSEATASEPSAQINVPADGVKEDVQPATYQTSIPPKYYLSLETGLETSLPPNDASLLLMNGRIGWQRCSPKGVTFSVFMSIFGAPSPQIDNGTIKTAGFRPGLGLSYLKFRRRIAFGPFFHVFVPYQKARLVLNDGVNRTDRWWNLRISPGGGLRINVGMRTQLQIWAGLSVQIRQKIFKQTSDGATLYRTPYLDGDAGIGVIFKLK